jgi:hypothetical protein
MHHPASGEPRHHPDKLSIVTVERRTCFMPAATSNKRLLLSWGPWRVEPVGLGHVAPGSRWA